jgi:hypothetical protein
MLPVVGSWPGVTLKEELAYRLPQRVSYVRGLCLSCVEVRTCNEFEWLGDIAAELLGVWHLNVGHLCGRISFELRV